MTKHETPWPMGLALATLAGVTVVVALVSEVFVASAQDAAATLGMTPAFVGFIVVALVGGAAEMASAFAGARKDRLDLSVGIALGAATQIALFVAPVLVLLSYVLGPAPMDLSFWPGAVVMMLVATITMALVTNGGRSAWFVGVLVLMVYLVFAMTLYLLPPGAMKVGPAGSRKSGVRAACSCLLSSCLPVPVAHRQCASASAAMHDDDGDLGLPHLR